MGLCPYVLSRRFCCFYCLILSESLRRHQLSEYYLVAQFLSVCACFHKIYELHGGGGVNAFTFPRGLSQCDLTVSHCSLQNDTGLLYLGQRVWPLFRQTLCFLCAITLSDLQPQRKRSGRQNFKTLKTLQSGSAEVPAIPASPGRWWLNQS